MQTYSYYSRILLIEYLQKTIFFKKGKSLNNNYYAYFMLNNKDRLFIIYNKNNFISKAYIKFENTNNKDYCINSSKINNNIDLENFVNNIDKYLKSKNLKKWFFNNDFDNLDLSINL